MTDAHIVVQCPLDQLHPPAEDVREGRDPEDIQGLASSMGDPDIGQRQAISVYPADPELRDDDLDADDLHDLFEDGEPLEIDDGFTRYKAAEMLGWSTLRAVVHPDAPDKPLIARLDANTEMSKMSDYEVFSALKEHYEETDATLADIGQKVGMADSSVSNIFRILDGPEWLVETWRADDHPLGTTDARYVLSFLTDDTLDRYQDAGDLTRAEARERAIEDAQLMIRQKAKHEVPSSEFGERCTRLKKQTVDDLKSSKDYADKQADGTADKADSLDTGPEPDPLDPCMVCGSERQRERRKSIPVDAQCYSMLADMESRGELLATNAGGDVEVSGSPAGDLTPREMARQGLAEFLGAPPEHVDDVLDELEQQAAQAPQQGSHG